MAPLLTHAGRWAVDNRKRQTLPEQEIGRNHTALSISSVERLHWTVQHFAWFLTVNSMCFETIASVASVDNVSNPVRAWANRQEAIGTSGRDIIHLKLDAGEWPVTCYLLTLTAHHVPLYTSHASLLGNENQNVAPSPTFPSAHTLPP